MPISRRDRAGQSISLADSLNVFSARTLKFTSGTGITPKREPKNEYEIQTIFTYRIIPRSVNFLIIYNKNRLSN